MNKQISQGIIIQDNKVLLVKQYVQEGASDHIKTQLEKALTLSEQTFNDKSKKKLNAVHAILFQLNKEFNAGNMQVTNQEKISNGV
jgi:hypothetical protein